MALSPALQDRLLFLTLGLSACLALNLIRRRLIHTRNAAIEAPPENKPQYITQEVEDSLKLSTLDKLLSSPNYAVQETAAIIVCERALHDGRTLNSLLWYITQPEYELREQGIRALSMIMNICTIAYIHLLHTPSSYAALIRSLTLSLNDILPHNRAPFNASWDNWYGRDALEQHLLLMLTQLTAKYGPQLLISQNFVSRWLAHEPWGTTPQERQTNLLACVTAQEPPFRLAGLVRALFHDREGREELIRAGLVAEHLRLPPPEPEGDTRMQGGEGTAGEGSVDSGEDGEEDGEREDFENMFVEQPAMRRVGQSVEEHLVRRRNREAMVLSDGMQPLGRGDIIQRER